MPARIDQWLTIKDFRPGIKGRVFPSGVSNRAGEVLGAAYALGTYACHALPDGSLGPLPRSTSNQTITLPVTPANTTTGRLTIGGMIAVGPIQTSSETHLAFEAKASSDSKRRWFWQRVEHWNSNTVETLLSFNPGTEGVIGTYAARPTFFDNFRANATDATLPGVPGTVAAWVAGGGTTDRVWHMWPAPATPATNTPVAISSSLDPTLAFVHQGRSIVFDQGSYSHGSTGTALWTHNEEIWFTKANLTTLDVSAAQTFGAENAAGYDAAISYNHQECMLIKHGAGGGLLIRGDLKSPTVLRLPGMPSMSRHRPAVTPVGVALLDAYATGAWLWSGGETAENISRDALDASLFYLGNQGTAGGEAGTLTDFLDYTGQVTYWRDWALFPNNWLWNWKEGSWWRLDAPANCAHFMHYSVNPGNTAGLQAAPAYVTANSDPVFYTYDALSPARTYRWTSLPIAGSENRMDMMREVVLVATGTGTVTLTFTNVLGATEVHAFSISSNSRPVYIRDNCDVNMQQLQLQIDVVASNDNVPVIHEVRMGVQSDKHFPLRTA